MHTLAVPVRWVLSVVVAGVQAWLHVATVQKESCAVECRTQAWDNGVMDSIVAALDGKRSAVTSKEIGCSWLCIAAVVAIAVERDVAHCAVDFTSGRLSVDSQRRSRVVAPNLIDIARPVIFERGGINAQIVRGRKHTEHPASTV